MGSAEDQRDDPTWLDSEDFVPGPLRPGASFRIMLTPEETHDGTVEDNILMQDDKDGPVDRKTELREHGDQTKTKRNKLHLRRRPTDDPLSDWSWLSEESPLMSRKSESEWIVERLSATLVRELKRQRGGRKRRPPIGMRHLGRSRKVGEKVGGD